MVVKLEVDAMLIVSAKSLAFTINASILMKPISRSSRLDMSVLWLSVGLTLIVNSLPTWLVISLIVSRVSPHCDVRKKSLAKSTPASLLPNEMYSSGLLVSPEVIVVSPEVLLI